MSYLVANPEDRFSRDEAQMMKDKTALLLKLKDLSKKERISNGLYSKLP